jgi:hypothetical protein
VVGSQAEYKAFYAHLVPKAAKMESGTPAGVGKSGGAGRRHRRGGRTFGKILENRRSSLDRALAVLTVEQKAKWQELTGKPFQGSVRLLLSSGRRLLF